MPSRAKPAEAGTGHMWPTNHATRAVTLAASGAAEVPATATPATGDERQAGSSTAAVLR